MSVHADRKCYKCTVRTDSKRTSKQVTVCLKMYSHLEERREKVYTVLVSVPKSFSARLAPPGWVPTGLGQCLLFHGCCAGLSGQTEPGITATSQPLPSGPLREHSQQSAATLAKLCSSCLLSVCRVWTGCPVVWVTPGRRFVLRNRGSSTPQAHNGGQAPEPHFLQ